MGKLKNPRWENFCQYYCVELNGKMYNATEAAKKAGFSKKTAYSQGHRLLKKDEIQKRIKEIKEETLKEIGIDRLWLLQKYKKIIEDDIKNYLSFREPKDKGEEFVHGSVVIEVKNLDEVDTWNVAEVSKGRDGQFKFKLYPKDKAMEKMGEYLDLFTPEASDGNKDKLTDIIDALYANAKSKVDE